MKLLIKTAAVLPVILASLYGFAAVAQRPTTNVNAFVTNESVPVQDVGDVTRHVFLNLSTPSGGGSCSNNQGFVQVNENGKVVGEAPGLEFVVPAGYVLNITDVSWSATPGSSGFNIGRSLVLALGVVNGSVPVYRSNPVLVTNANYQALLGGNESLKAGVNVGSGNKICLGLSDYYYGGGNTWQPGVVHLRGMLLPAPPR